MQETEEFNFKSYMNSVKNRLKNNNYARYRQTTKIKSKFKLLSGVFSNLEIEVKRICNNEAELYNKVAEILNSETICPLAELTDKELFEKLNDEEKQRYMLNLSAKFNEIKKQIEQNKEAV